MGKNQLIDGKLIPKPNEIIVSNMDRGLKVTLAGIIVPNDEMTERGIHPRWAKVHRVGSNIDYLTAGQWVLIEHGYWSHIVEIVEDGIPYDLQVIIKKNMEHLLMVSDTCPDGVN
jgi:hypothetical protein